MELAGLEPATSWVRFRTRWDPFAETTSFQAFSWMRPNPSDPERTPSVAIVATRLRSERQSFGPTKRVDPGSIALASPRLINGERRSDERTLAQARPISPGEVSSLAGHTW